MYIQMCIESYTNELALDLDEESLNASSCVTHSSERSKTQKAEIYDVIGLNFIVNVAL